MILYILFHPPGLYQVPVDRLVLALSTVLNLTSSPKKWPAQTFNIRRPPPPLFPYTLTQSPLSEALRASDMNHVVQTETTLIHVVVVPLRLSCALV